MYKTEDLQKEERHLSMAREVATTLIDSFTVEEKTECIKTIRQLIIDDYDSKMKNYENSLADINKEREYFMSNTND